MKIVHILCVVVMIWLVELKPCKKKLMESFDLDGHDSTFPYGNIVCNTIANDSNCCSYLNQLRVYQNWAINKQRKKILNFYNEFHDTFKDMFDTFKKIED